jgi:hypothetical protein
VFELAAGSHHSTTDLHASMGLDLSLVLVHYSGVLMITTLHMPAKIITYSRATK